MNGILESSWKSQKAKLKLYFPQLTSADLNFDEGDKYQMLDNLQTKLGFTPSALEVISLS